jgi:hypothetical protein
MDMQALVASLARIGWINFDYLNTRTKSFVVQEHSQLVERP